MYSNLTIHFNRDSHLFYDANKNLFTYVGKFANKFLNHCIKHQITDSELIFDELRKIKEQTEADTNINIFNTVSKSISEYSCSNCNDSGYVESYEDQFPCGHCEGSRLIEAFDESYL